MLNIKRVLVAMDLTEMDEILVRYVTRLSQEIHLDKIYFLNVVKKLELPKKILEKYPNIVAPMDEATKADIQFTINKEAGDRLKVDYDIKVSDGSITKKIIKWAKIKEVDLIIVGRKTHLDGVGIVTSRVVNLAPCSVAIVPEVLPQTDHNIVVPIDGSKASLFTFHFAEYVAANVKGMKLTCLSVYDVPTGYTVSGKSYEDFAEIMRGNAEKTLFEFITKNKKSDVPIEAVSVLNNVKNIAKKIYQFAIKNQASAILIGSKGKTQTEALLLGSTVAKLIKMNIQIPLVVVNPKKHNLDFLHHWIDI